MQFLQGHGALLDPASEAFGNHIEVGDDGRSVGLTVEGKILVKQLHLDSSPAIDNRLDAIKLYQLYEEMPHHPLVREKYLRHFGFPDNLPNLAILRPDRKSVANSARNSYY
jgi:hypothetical protein